jgi:hypothetical protein
MLKSEATKLAHWSVRPSAGGVTRKSYLRGRKMTVTHVNLPMERFCWNAIVLNTFKSAQEVIKAVKETTYLIFQVGCLFTQQSEHHCVAGEPIFLTSHALAQFSHT